MQHHSYLTQVYTSIREHQARIALEHIFTDGTTHAVAEIGITWELLSNPIWIYWVWAIIVKNQFSCPELATLYQSTPHTNQVWIHNSIHNNDRHLRKTACTVAPAKTVKAEWRIYASENSPSSVQIMACRLDGVKPLSEPILEYCYLDPWDQTSVKS